MHIACLFLYPDGFSIFISEMSANTLLALKSSAVIVKITLPGVVLVVTNSISFPAVFLIWSESKLINGPSMS